MTGRKIKVGGAAYARLPAGTRVKTPTGKTVVVHKKKRSARPSSPLPKKGYRRYSQLKLGKQVRSPTTGRKISVGSAAYRQLYSGVVDLKQSPHRGLCRQYPYVPDEFLCGKKCSANSCYPVNSSKRYAAAYGYSRKYYGNSPKGKCIRKCADKIKAKYGNSPAWVGGKYRTPYYASPKRVKKARKSSGRRKSRKTHSKSRSPRKSRVGSPKKRRSPYGGAGRKSTAGRPKSPPRGMCPFGGPHPAGTRGCRCYY